MIEPRLINMFCQLTLLVTDRGAAYRTIVHKLR
jgi:hypothetical protein